MSSRLRTGLGLVATLALVAGAVGPGAPHARAIPLGFSLSPTSLDYGDVAVGQSTSLSVTVTNDDALAHNVSAAAITGDAASDYVVTADSCSGESIDAAASCLITVQFSPTDVGDRLASLDIPTDDIVGTHSVPLSGTGFAPESPVTWGTTHAAGPAYTWTAGNALSRTVQSGTQRLHLVYTTDRVGGKWVKNSGPYLGVYYTRSTSGSTWSKGKRLNSSSQHGDRGTTASAGSRVYALWVSQTRYNNFSPTAPRVLYVRVNTGHGAATKWKSAIRLTSKTGRVDYPTIAATGSDAYIAWTDAKTGKIKLAISHDGGGSWSTKSIGTTTYHWSEGYEGVPVVAVSGSTVVVAWAATQDNQVKVRVSTNKGSTFGSSTVLAATSAGVVSAAARGSRAAVAWIDDSGVAVAVRSAGSWGAARVVAGPAGTQYGPAVALQDTNRVAVAWGEDLGGGTQLRWAESPDNGVAWYAPQTVADNATASHVENDWPSVVWPKAGTRIVTWNGWTSGTLNYREYIRIGSGTPVGILAVAPVLAPGSTARMAIGAAVLRAVSKGHVRR